MLILRGVKKMKSEVENILAASRVSEWSQPWFRHSKVTAFATSDLHDAFIQASAIDKLGITDP